MHDRPQAGAQITTNWPTIRVLRTASGWEGRTRMADLTGKVAVVTGAARGIGLAIAERCLAEGMSVVLADVEEDALELAADKLAQQGKVLAVPTDVSVEESVVELRRQAEAFGPVRLLCNNAGVTSPLGPAWGKRTTEWKWVLGVNLWGVIHGIKTFLPAMLERDEGNIVNTASVAGLLPMPFGAPYAATEHAVAGISISVHHELAMVGSQVRVSVLCPGWIRTKLVDADRNWPASLGPRPEPGSNQMSQRLDAMARQFVDTGMEPDGVPVQVLESGRNGRVWILPTAA